ncbi:hypothetical protein GJ744_000687 [Endocarpon pusillum]|uniref:Mediator of RNA polymerase II transcription subunit 9 n=1 Tax=Endocarpon pusillum TaxID=364733 RepID=A0A8H7E1Q0_9EURO|nr:hypothetical protein GJ744_000687 [Endocarpon pusillum]
MPSPTAPKRAPAPSTPSTSTVPFPPPQTFDILPQIYDLVTRLPHASLVAQTTTSTSTPHPSITDPLDPKDLPQAAVPIKLKIQKARAAVSAMPDVGRSIEEQGDEIQELQKRIGRLRGVLGELGRRASEGKRGGELVRGNGKEM